MKLLRLFLALLFLALAPSAFATTKPQASSTQDEDGNIAFKFDGDTSVRIAKKSATSGGICSSASEGAIRYSTSLKTIEFCNGSAWTTFGGTGPKNIVTFSSPGTWTYTPTSGTSRVLVKVVGGGGNGAGGNLGGYGGGGGGSGGHCEKLYDVSSGTSVTLTVGAVGGTSSFSSCIATGGGSGNTTIPGSAGIASGGNVNMNGGRGKAPPNATNAPIGGDGADGPWGGGGGGDSGVGPKGVPHTYVNATIYGGGGGGGYGGPNDWQISAGGAGAPGIVIVYEY